MLYNPQANLAFLHIPKNGGQSVRSALLASGKLSFSAMAADLGVTECEAELLMEAGTDRLPECGTVQPEHVPLAFLRSHFPASWQTLRQARSFVLVRAPRDRFFSALLQRLREHRGMTALRGDDPLVAVEALHVCAWLEARDAFCDMEYIHFSRQIDYVEVDGTRIVSAIFPLNRTDAVAGWVCAHCGLDLAIPHEHARREPRKWAGAVQPAARFIGRKVLPPALKKALYPIWMNSGAFADAASRYGAITLDDEVEHFIARYYAPDAALYEEAVRAVKPPLLSAVA